MAVSDCLGRNATIVGVEGAVRQFVHHSHPIGALRAAEKLAAGLECVSSELISRVAAAITGALSLVR